MKKSFLFFVSFLFLFLCSSSSSLPNRTENPNPKSAHDELKSNGFPIGLLPSGVLNFTLNRTSGDFSVHFLNSCQITLPPDNYLATYSRRITGKILEGRIAEIQGVCVRAFFKWWSITEIRLIGENLVFKVGVVTAKYPSKNFDKSLECNGSPHSSSDI